MSDLIVLKCPTCGANLETKSRHEMLRCAFCGSTHSLRQTVTGADKMAAEMAISRLSQEIKQLEARRQDSTEEPSGTNRRNWPGYLLFFLLVAGILSFAFAVNGNTATAATMFVLFVVTILVRHRANAAYHHQAGSKANAKAQRIAKEIGDQQTTLAYSQQIADA